MNNEPKLNGEMVKCDFDWNKRLLIFTPSRGSVRMEWVMARYGQIIPTNWSMVQMVQFLSPFVPVAYQLADAQNLMAKKVIQDDYEWVLYLEDDNIPPADAFIKINEYINDGKIPVVSGLYFTKSIPGEPVLYRGQGTSYFGDWKLGDKIWVDGIPFGFRLENAKLIKEAWKTSEEYMVGTEKTRRVFGQPNKMWFDEEKGGMVSKGGTTDLAWCARIIDEKLFEKAGFPEFQKKKYPFLVDSSIFLTHIDQNGRQYPTQMPERYVPEKGYVPREITD